MPLTLASRYYLSMMFSFIYWIIWFHHRDRYIHFPFSFSDTIFLPSLIPPFHIFSFHENKILLRSLTYFHVIIRLRNYWWDTISHLMPFALLFMHHIVLTAFHIFTSFTASFPPSLFHECRRYFHFIIFACYIFAHATRMLSSKQAGR